MYRLELERVKKQSDTELASSICNENDIQHKMFIDMLNRDHEKAKQDAEQDIEPVTDQSTDQS